MKATIIVMDYSNSSVNVYTDVDVDIMDELSVERFIMENGHRMSACYYMTGHSTDLFVNGAIVTTFR